MSRASNLIGTMEREMGRTHRAHVSRVQAKTLATLVAERMKPSQDQERIQKLHEEAVSLEREKDDKSYARTKRDLIAPLQRQAVNERAIAGKVAAKHKQQVQEAKERTASHGRKASIR